jgi:hypothetical protein
VNDSEIDAALNRAARPPHGTSAALLEQIANSIQSTLLPVRPLLPGWLLTAALLLSGVVVALLGAARAGFLGIDALAPLSRLVIFASLTILWVTTATQVVSAWIPGSRRVFSPVALLLGVSISLLAVFWLEFSDYRTERFVSQGLRCLVTGLMHALVAALLGLWVLSRGYALNPVTAALALGVLGGISGVTMLELHCANFEALHVLVWHTLVVPISGVAGALTGWALARRKRRTSPA